MTAFDEQESYQVQGIYIRCTMAEHREIMMRLRSSKEYLRWHALDTMARMIHVCAENKATLDRQEALMREIAGDLADSEAAMTSRLLQILGLVVHS